MCRENLVRCSSVGWVEIKRKEGSLPLAQTALCGTVTSELQQKKVTDSVINLFCVVVLFFFHYATAN